MKKIITSFLFVFITTATFAQKTIYIPSFFLDTSTVDGKQFSLTKTAQSENFAVFWGDSVGLNPLQPKQPHLRFDPIRLLDSMELIYQEFKKLGFLRDSIGTNLYKYKSPIIMLNTFGPKGRTGYAHAYGVDGIMGAFLIDPSVAVLRDYLAHEYAHAIQFHCNVDYRYPNIQLGWSWKNTRLFNETHATFMTNVLYPNYINAGGMDIYGMSSWGQWTNSYENDPLLFSIMEEDGIDIINKMWYESFDYEYPIEAYKRLSGLSQDDLNNKMYRYARRMSTLDFNYKDIGSYLRQRRNFNLNTYTAFNQTTYTILKKDPLVNTHFIASYEIAPEEYGYNIIPLNPIKDSCAVIIKFKGHTDANDYAGWRYGFVTSLPDGTISRYSDIYSDNESVIGFSLLPSESQMYLVVMGAPNLITTNPEHDTWQGYAKRYRFPYELMITGGYPEGHQPPSEFRKHLKNDGRIHSNGGGWVSNSSSVSNSVYVGPHAMVMGNSSITGNVQIKNTAMVQNSIISGNVKVLENALVIKCVLSDDVTITGNGFVENCNIYDSALVNMRARVWNYKLHGNIHVGGDVNVYNDNGDCDNGVYLRMTNYFQNNLLECDNRTASHPQNTDVNNVYKNFTNEQMQMNCNCINYPNCLSLSVNSELAIMEDILIFPNPVNNILNIKLSNSSGNYNNIKVFNVTGSELYSAVDNSDFISIDVSKFSKGIYLIQIQTEKGTLVKKISIEK